VAGPLQAVDVGFEEWPTEAKMRGWARAKSLLQRMATDRRRRLVVAGSVVFVVLTIAALFLSRQLAIGGLRRELASLKAQQVEATARQKELRADVASTSDPKTLEDEARRRLGLIRSGEEKIFFVEEDSP
jgi:cell division protein FtsB